MNNLPKVTRYLTAAERPRVATSRVTRLLDVGVTVSILSNMVNGHSELRLFNKNGPV